MAVARAASLIAALVVTLAVVILGRSVSSGTNTDAGTGTPVAKGSRLDQLVTARARNAAWPSGAGRILDIRLFELPRHATVDDARPRGLRTPGIDRDRGALARVRERA